MGWRRILVDDTSTLHQLHLMIQILWLGDYHPARFDRRTVNHFLVLTHGWLGLGA